MAGGVSSGRVGNQRWLAGVVAVAILIGKNGSSDGGGSGSNSGHGEEVEAVVAVISD